MTQAPALLKTKPGIAENPKKRPRQRLLPGALNYYVSTNLVTISAARHSSLMLMKASAGDAGAAGAITSSAASICTWQSRMAFTPEAFV